MALVCDFKSNSIEGETAPKTEEEVDLEDGEIEDDDEEVSSAPAPPDEPLKPEVISPQKTPSEKGEKERLDKGVDNRPKERERSERRRHDEKGKKHMTEAEKSILHLRKREEMQRKKWEKFNRNKEAVVDPMDDDFAKNIEKTLATILSKKEKEAQGIVSGSESADKDKDNDEKRGRKRRKNEKDRKFQKKQRRLDSPKPEEMEENEMMNIRGVSPGRYDEVPGETPSGHSEDSGGDSEYSSDRSKSDERGVRRRGMGGKRGIGRNRDRGDAGGRNKNRNKNNEQQLQPQQQPLKDSKGVCVFYLQGKCQKNDCPYSHEAVPPMKLELCKFYLMDCCAKGDKCSYMHSEFPCKFYHTGLNCAQGDNCKFAHGKSLSEGLKQILFKHIETAPRDILGGFPRMSREEALNMINVTQSKLQEQQGIVPNDGDKDESKGGIPSLFDINVPVPPELLQGCDDKMNKSDKPSRNRPSRWQDPEPHTVKDMGYPGKSFSYGQDQDMRINSNGDIDMRTLPPVVLPTSATTSGLDSNSDIDLEKYKREAGLLGSPKQDLDIRPKTISSFPPLSRDIDIRRPPMLASSRGDIDIRRLGDSFDTDRQGIEVERMDDASHKLHDMGESLLKREVLTLPVDLPKTQKNLFMRIHAHQKESNVVESDNKGGFEMDDNNINWYSDDDDEDDDRLTIKVDSDEVKEKEEVTAEPIDTGVNLISPPHIKPQEVVEKLGDLSKIDISAEVTKLLTSMSQNRNKFPLPSETKDTIQATPVPASVPNDPRSARQDPRISQDKPESSRTDPRLLTSDTKQRSRQSSTETVAKPEKLSIYEQGSIDMNSTDDLDIDIRTQRSDVDLRQLQLPFGKGGALLRNYTPASEIDASFASHPPIVWRITRVEVPRPDYTGLKLNPADAEKTGDPRLRKIFRLGSTMTTEERDTPLSPKASPKGAGMNTRVDPRLRKMEENKTMSDALNYNQQVNMLQSSVFYQSLTSNQKLLLNQELSQRNDSSNSHDPVLNSMLSNLNIIPGANVPSNPNLGAALSILSNVAKLNNPMLNQGQPVNPTIMGQNPNLMNQMAQSIAQPGLLGAAPGIPNLPPDFPINFDPRNGGLLGNAPMPFVGFPNQDGPGGNYNYNDDFYPPSDGGGGGNNFQPNRDNRGFNRDRRRGRNNFNNRNNGGNRNFRNNRNNRANRTHSPP